MAKEKQEYDYEGDMAMSQLKSIIANAQRIHDMLERDTNLPEWVQSKITLAEDYISTTANYMQGEMKEDMQIDELSKDTLKSYAAKADARTMDRTIDNPKAHKKAQNRTFGIEKAIKKIAEEGEGGPVNVAANVADPQNKRLFAKPAKRIIPSFKSFAKK
jgi:serine protease inhibitor